MELIDTGNKNLNLILNGGLHRRGSYLLRGSPGTGKTVLSNQIAFHHIKSGGKVLYLSGLAENNDTYIQHLKSFTFFSPEQVHKNLYYYSALSFIDEGLGIDEMAARIIQQIQNMDISLFVIDCFQSFDPFLKNKDDGRILVNKLKAAATVLDVTLLVIHTPAPQQHLQEESDLDGIIELSLCAFGAKRARMIEVLKLRGQSYLLGPHSFKIDNDGLNFFPRTESLYRGSERGCDKGPCDFSRKLKFGIEGLDSMLKGGVTEGSMTTVVGAPGVGKTSFGVKFLMEGCEAGEQGLYIGFDEPINRLSEKLNGLNISLSKEITSGSIHAFWVPDLGANIDELTELILTKARENKVTRVFIDGVRGLRETVEDDSRFRDVLITLCNELRNQEVTAVFSDALHLFPKSYDINVREHASIMENIVYLGYFEEGNSLQRFMTIIKVRDDDYNHDYKKITLSPAGIQVEDLPKKVNLFSQKSERTV